MTVAPTSTVRLLSYRRFLVIPPIVASALYVYFLRSYSTRRKTDLASSKTMDDSVAAGASTSGGAGKKPQRPRVGVNMRFLRQMKMLLPVLVPGPFSREAGLLVALAGVLIARTWLDIWFSAFNGQVVKSIVSRDRATFVARAGIEFGLMMWPLSVVNNSLKLLINALSISFRERLTKVPLFLLYCIVFMLQFVVCA